MKVLIIGLGSIAIKHIQALRYLYPNPDIYALRSGVNNTRFENVHNIYSLTEIPLSIDFAIISNSTHLHFDSIKKMVELEIPIMVEKPVVHSLSSVNKLQKYLEDKTVFNYVACNLRFNPCIQFLNSALKERLNAINEVNIYCGSYLPDWRTGKDFTKVYSSNADMGGGVHLDLFHELDYSFWLFGEPNNYKAFKSNTSTLAIAAADYANYLLCYDRFNISVILNYYRRKPKRTIEILFENETWTVDILRNIIENDIGKIIFEHPDFNILDTYVEQLRYFIDCMENKQRPMNAIEESLQILKVCLNYE
ncbi:Gfo/Idh/MocA family oxidoreductase [Daejeonella sp.]|uniref:Gfo/Idh/MocA family protein n=1 Tax=Daejeonella sp. TaxID=2805397 RepID=UPI0030C143E5